MTSRYLLFIFALAFSTVLACRTAPLPQGDGGGGSGGGGGGGSSLDLTPMQSFDLTPPSPDFPNASECGICGECGGPCCGNMCCNKGERCDTATLTCRCGNGPACTNGNVCTLGGPAAPFGYCGDVCCGGPATPCPV